MATRPRRISRSRKSRKDQSSIRWKWSPVVNPYRPIEILSDDQVEAIHQATLAVLRDVGIKFNSSKARKLFQQAGAKVDCSSQIVYFDPALVEQEISKAPSNFTVKARTPEKSIVVGGQHINFATVGGPSFVSDFDKGRRSGTLADLKNFFKVASELQVFHSIGSNSFEPLDLPVRTRHLDKYLAAITIHDRVWMANMLGAFRARDSLEMLTIVHGINMDELYKQPLTIGNINVNSPRQVDEAMSDSLIEFAKFGQVVLVTPFTLLGAMAPTTMAGALVQQNAEALACIALAQIVNPGAPVIYGSFASNVDLKTGSPAFGTPEYIRTTFASGQLARRYSLPYRSSGSNASNFPDEQATYETCMSIWAATMAHSNLLLHGGGWLEGGLVASFEKLVIDAEILQILSHSFEPLVVNEDTLAVQAIADIPPGGHFFGSSHTLQRYTDIFYTPLLSDWRNYETWLDDGARTASKRANTIWKSILQEYTNPPLDIAILEELTDFVKRRKADIEAGKEEVIP